MSVETGFKKNGIEIAVFTIPVAVNLVETQRMNQDELIEIINQFEALINVIL